MAYVPLEHIEPRSFQGLPNLLTLWVIVSLLLLIYPFLFESELSLCTWLLKTLDTIGNCQRPVFSLCVSQPMHTITNLCKFEPDWSSEKKNCHTKMCAFRCLIWRPQILNLRSRNQISEKILLSWKLDFTSKGAVSHNVLYHQPLPITCYQVRFYADNYFE